jgi:hypothetical protein
MYCEAVAAFQDNHSFGSCAKGDPSLGAGASGSAVIAGMDPQTGLGNVIGILTGQTSTEMWGTPIGDVETAIYQMYQGRTVSCGPPIGRYRCA